MNNTVFVNVSQVLFGLLIVGAAVYFNLSIQKIRSFIKKEEIEHVSAQVRLQTRLGMFLFLAASAVRDAIPTFFGAQNWTDLAIALASGARVFQTIGLLVIIRAATISREGERSWLIALGVAALISALLPP